MTITNTRASVPLTHFILPNRKSSRPRGDDESRPFFQHFALAPNTASIHYNAKRLDLTGLKNGNLVELMNLFSLEGSEIALPRVCGRGWLPVVVYVYV